MPVSHYHNSYPVSPFALRLLPKISFAQERHVFIISDLKSGGGEVIAVVLTAECFVVGYMQAITEWQKLKLRKAGFHRNIKINQIESHHHHQNIKEENDLVETRFFAILIVALCAAVIMYRYNPEGLYSPSCM